MNDEPRPSPDQRDPVIDEMIRSLDRLADTTNADLPPLEDVTLDDVTTRREPTDRRRWAAAASLVAAGIAAIVIAGRLNDTGDPATTAESGPTAGRDGPVIISEWRPNVPPIPVIVGPGRPGDTRPSGTISEREPDGTLQLRNGCTWVQAPRNGALTPLVWPPGTQWDDETRSVHLEDGASIQIGDNMSAAGPQILLPRLRTEAPEIAAVIDDCVQDQSTDGDIHVIFHNLAPYRAMTPPPPTTTAP